jgi:hypothetical protein
MPGGTGEDREKFDRNNSAPDRDSNLKQHKQKAAVVTTHWRLLAYVRGWHRQDMLGSSAKQELHKEFYSKSHFIQEGNNKINVHGIGSENINCIELTEE